MDNNSHITPSFRQHLNEIYAAALSPDDFLRVSGEMLALYDTRWKEEFNAHRPVAGPLRQFICVGLLHSQALGVANLIHEACLTMSSMLISVDMTGTDTSLLADDYICLQAAFLQATSALKARYASDAFARPHIDAVTAHAATLFLHFTASSEQHSTRIEGLRTACRKLLTDMSLPLEIKTSDVSQILVDIFQRLQVLE